MRKACAVCGALAEPGKTRCATHAIPSRGQAHRVAARQTLREEGRCWRCGTVGSPLNPLTAGHIVARSRGGADARWNMRAECRRCNSQGGAALTNRDSA